MPSDPNEREMLISRSIVSSSSKRRFLMQTSDFVCARADRINIHNRNWSGYYTVGVFVYQNSCVTMCVCWWANEYICGLLQPGTQRRTCGSMWYTYYAHAHIQSSLYLDHWRLRQKTPMIDCSRIIQWAIFFAILFCGSVGTAIKWFWLCKYCK